MKLWKWLCVSFEPGFSNFFFGTKRASTPKASTHNSLYNLLRFIKYKYKKNIEKKNNSLVTVHYLSHLFSGCADVRLKK